MSDVRPTLSPPASGPHGTVPGVRPLTPDEIGHLDRARAHLRSSGADVDDPRAVGVLLHSARTQWADGPATAVPQAMVMALGVGVGDLIVARVPGARWALRIGSSPTPAVVSASGEDAALPLTDVGARWHTGCTPGWVAEYVAAAADHLAAGAVTEVPSPRTPGRAHELTPETDGPDYLPAPPTAGGQPLSSRRPTPPLAARPVSDQSVALRALAEAAGAPRPADATPTPGQRPAEASAPLASRQAGEAYRPIVVGNAPLAGRARSEPSAPRATPLAADASAADNPVAGQRPVRTPADLPHPPSHAAQDIALGALDQALEAALGGTGTLTTFALVDGGPAGSHELRRFDADASPDAREWVRSSGAARAAVAWIGRLPGDAADQSSVGARAVLVEASDAGAPSLVVAHRFAPAVTEGEGRARPARAVGEPLVLGQGAPLL